MTPIISIVGRKDSGKTTLIEGLVPELKRRGYKIGVIKHEAHPVNIEDIDRKGKDTYRYSLCGSDIVVLAGKDKLMIIKKDPLSLDDIVETHLSGLDLILAEGYKSLDKPKIEVLKEKELLCASEDNLVAIVSDHKPPLSLPSFSPNDYKNIAGFLEKAFICKNKDTETALRVNNKRVFLKGFVANFLKNTILGMLSSLHDIPKNPKEISIRIREK